MTCCLESRSGSGDVLNPPQTSFLPFVILCAFLIHKVTAESSNCSRYVRTYVCVYVNQQGGSPHTANHCIYYPVCVRVCVCVPLCVCVSVCMCVCLCSVCVRTCMHAYLMCQLSTSLCCWCCAVTLTVVSAWGTCAHC